MKSLLKYYIDLLSMDQLKNFLIKNNINLKNNEIDYLFKLIKNNWKDILINDNKYLLDLKQLLNQSEFLKIENLYIYYKDKYKNYLF